MTVVISPPIPAGTLHAYAGSTAPDGYLLCDGSAVSRTTYSQLFGVVGTTYGVGNGSTTFNLPDLRGRIPVGKDNMGGSAANRITSGGSGITGTTLGATGGAETHTLTTAQLASHNHGVTDPGHSHGGDYNVAAAAGGNQSNPAAAGTANYYAATRGATTGISIQNAGSGSAHNNVQPALVVNYIIKV